MGNSLSSLNGENIQTMNNIIENINEALLLMKNDKISIGDREICIQIYNKCIKNLSELKINTPMIYFMDINDVKFDKKDEKSNIWFLRTCENEDDILYDLRDLVNNNPDFINKSIYCKQMNHGDIIEIEKNSPSYRSTDTLFVFKKDGVFKLYFTENTDGEGDFKTCGESNLPSVFLSESSELSVNKFSSSNTKFRFHGSSANLSLKFLMELIKSNPEFFIDYFDAYLDWYKRILPEGDDDNDVQSITLLKLDWGIFVFNKDKYELFDYIINPKHSNYILGFGYLWDLPETWKIYIKKTGKPYVVCLAWHE